MQSYQAGQVPIVVHSSGSSSIFDRVGISLPVVILPRSSSSVSRNITLEVWGRKHSLALVVFSIQDMRFWVGWVSRVWIEV